jgi:hypothetical protein
MGMGVLPSAETSGRFPALAEMRHNIFGETAHHVARQLLVLAVI